MKPTLCLFLLGWVLAAGPAAADPLVDISHRDKFYDLEVRGDEVFVVGYPGLLLHSADRGSSWNQIAPGTDDVLYAIALNKAGQGIIVGRAGLVLTSADSGKSWSRTKTDVKSHLFDVALTDSGHAWAVGHFGIILHSPDGGKTWEEQSYDANFPPPPEGEEGSESNKSLSAAEEENEGAVEEARLNGVAFANEKTGWIAGEFGLVLHTGDGGKTWKRQRGSSGLLLFSLLVFDAQKVMAFGSAGTCMQTADGGAHWKSVDMQTELHLLSADARDGKVFVAGREGLVLVRDQESGQVERKKTGLYVWLNAIHMLDAKVGFAAGGRGYLLKTDDGGATWRRLAGR